MTGQEKLPDGLECCFKALAKAVFSEEGTVYFHRTFISFDGSDRTRVITRYANTAMEKGGDIAVAARAVMIYPAIKWLLKSPRCPKKRRRAISAVWSGCSRCWCG